MAKEKRKTPIYISISRVEKIFELLSKRSSSSYSSPFFEGHGFSNSDANLAIAGLRFLGLVDEQGKVTDKMTVLAFSGEKRTEGLKEILEASYAQLFEAVNEPYNLSLEELSNEMVVQYKISRRVASPAALAFLKLSEYAGFKEPGSISGRKRKLGTTKQKIDKENNQGLKKLANKRDKVQGYGFRIPIVEGEMYIEMPEWLNKESFLNDDINADLRGLIKKANEFAEKHLKSETPVPEEEIKEGGGG